MPIPLLFPAPPPPPPCRNCGRAKNQHQAHTFACPFGRGSFPSFRSDQHYEPREPRGKAGR